MKMPSATDSPIAASDSSLFDFFVDLIEEKEVVQPACVQSESRKVTNANQTLEEAQRQLCIKDESIQFLALSNGRLQLELAEKEAIAKVVVEENKTLETKSGTVSSENAQLKTRIEEVAAEILKLKSGPPPPTGLAGTGKVVKSVAENIEPCAQVAKQADQLVELSVRPSPD